MDPPHVRINSSCLPGDRALAIAVADSVGAGLVRAESRGQARSSAGNGTIYIGTYPNQFWIIDEATREGRRHRSRSSRASRGARRCRATGRASTPSKRQMEKVEIIDIAARKTIDSFTLSERNKHVRIRSIEPDPQHRFVMLVTKTATKLSDRFEIGAPTLLQYDLASHKHHPHHSVAERRRARERQHPVLARRQA